MQFLQTHTLCISLRGAVTGANRDVYPGKNMTPGCMLYCSNRRKVFMYKNFYDSRDRCGVHYKEKYPTKLNSARLYLLITNHMLTLSHPLQYLISR